MAVSLTVTPSAGDGVTVAFTLSAAPINAEVYAGGNLRGVGNSSAAHSIVALILTFTTAPAPGEQIIVLCDGTVPAFATASTAAAVRSYTTSELIASIRQKTFTAGTPRDFDDSSVLRVLNEMATTYLLKLIAKRRTNYLVETQDLAVTAGIASYGVPSVAMAGALRSVALVIGNIPYGLIEMDLPTAVASNLTPLSTAFPVGYYMMGPNVVLWPTQSLAGTLRIHYHRRPSTIVLESQCIQITGLPGGAAAGNYRVSFSSSPSGFAGGALCDVVSNSPNFYRWQTSAVLSGFTSTTADIPGTQPAALAAGDWLCLAGTAPVVTDAPAEVIEALLQKCAVKMMEGKGSDESMSRMLKGLADAEDEVGPLIQVRNTGSQRKLSAFPESAGWPWSGA